MLGVSLAEALSSGACSGGAATGTSPHVPARDAGTGGALDATAVPLDMPAAADPLPFVPRPAEALPPITPAVTLPQPSGGFRIRAVNYQGSDGAAGLPRWHDAALEMECIWGTAADGRTRCLPAAASVESPPVRFGDTKCQKPALVVTRPACGAVPSSILTATLTGCPQRTAVHRLGRKLDVTRVFFQSEAGMCLMSETSIGDNDDIYERGEEIPPETFAEATARVGRATGNLAPVFWDIDGGGTFVARHHDVAGNFDCVVRTAADGKQRCLPVGATASGNFFADAACLAPVARDVHSECQPEGAFIMRPVAQSCPVNFAAHLAGDRSSTTFARSMSTCAPVAANAAIDSFTLGVEVPASTFVAMSSGVSPGAGRLRAEATSGPAGTLASGGLWDSKLGLFCTVGTAADGVTRCLPRNRAVMVAAAGSFADAQCMVRLVARPAQECQTPAHAATVDAAMCPVRLHVFGVSAEPHSGMVYLQNPQGCVGGPPNPNLRYFRLSPEIPAGEFAEITRTPR